MRVIMLNHDFANKIFRVQNSLCIQIFNIRKLGLICLINDIDQALVIFEPVQDLAFLFLFLNPFWKLNHINQTKYRRFIFVEEKCHLIIIIPISRHKNKINLASIG